MFGKKRELGVDFIKKITLLLIVFLLSGYATSVYCFDRGGKRKKGFKLITILYNEIKSSRCAEYMLCLERNLQHSLIEEIHVLYDDSCDDSNNFLLAYLKTRSVNISYVHDRPTYSDCFAYANKNFPNSKIILANADIFFDATLNLLDGYDFTNKFFALTRYDLLLDGSIQKMKTIEHGKKCDNFRTQDAWFFSTPLREIRGGGIRLGTFGCDIAIAYYVAESGLTILNPCLSVYCYHLHNSNVRNYNEKVFPYENVPERGVPWCMLETK